MAFSRRTFISIEIMSKWDCTFISRWYLGFPSKWKQLIPVNLGIVWVFRWRYNNIVDTIFSHLKIEFLMKVRDYLSPKITIIFHIIKIDMKFEK